MKQNYSRAFGWALLYLCVILLFALFYLCLPTDQWGRDECIQDFGGAFYFSVVTITSLGFGDIYPAAGTNGRYLVATEAILGILIIGFFLNDIAIRQSVRLDKEAKENEEKKKREQVLAYRRPRRFLPANKAIAFCCGCLSSFPHRFPLSFRRATLLCLGHL